MANHGLNPVPHGSAWLRYPLGLAVVFACAAGLCSGCKCYQPPRRRPVEELYQDALIESQSSPEFTLGLENRYDPGIVPTLESIVQPPAPLQSGSVLPSYPEMAPSAWVEPPTSMPAPSAPTLPAQPGWYPPTATGSSVSEPFPAPPALDDASASRLSRPADGPPAHRPPGRLQSSGWRANPSAADDAGLANETTAARPGAFRQSLPLIGELNRSQRIRSAQRLARTRHVQQVSGNDELRVSEIFQDTDLRQAIQSLAAQVGVSVIIDDQIAGVTSALIEDEPFETALRKVLLPAGLVYTKRGNEFLVGSADPESPMFHLLSTTMEYHALHLGPTELITLLPERQKQFTRVAEKRNLIIIEAHEVAAKELLDRLVQLDQPVPQVVLEAIICVISPDSGFKSGLDWNHALTVNGRDLLNLGMTGLAFNGSASPSGVADAFTDFSVTSAFVRLLAQEGYLTIRAAPRVMAKDGETASINIARETFFSTLPQNSDVFFRQDIEKVEAGISMEIIPVIRGDNVTVTIDKAEVSEDIRTTAVNTQVTNNPYPLINRRTVKTTVHVKDGQTIVIGGLVQKQTVDRMASIPVLGKLPGIGRMFQTVERQEQDAEVVIFISPRIVRPGCDAARPVIMH